MSAAYTDCNTPENMHTGACMNTCMASPHPDWCDVTMSNMCADSRYVNDPACACFDPAFNQAFPGLGITACFKPGCVNNGQAYKTKDMNLIAQNCPSFCGNILVVQADGKLVDSSITQIVKAKCSGSSSLPCGAGGLDPQKTKIVVGVAVGIIVALILVIILQK